MSKDKDDNINEEEAAFNDALKTLGRIAVPLDEIKNLDYLYPPESIEKQKAFINLVRRFFVLCTPLLKKEDSDRYKDEVLKMQMKKKSGIKAGQQSLGYIYSQEIEFRLNEILIEIQQLLRKFFMPKRREDDGL